MAIRVRQGLYDDFDPTKMLPGEWAVSVDKDTSKQIVWMCFAPGVTKRMGTYEDFKQQVAELTENIKEEYVKEFQVLLNEMESLLQTSNENTNAVIQIREEVVNTYLPKMLEYLSGSQTAALNAAQSEANALQYAKDSLTNANNAKASEESTLAYKNAAATSAADAEKSNQASRKSADDSEESARQSAQSEANSLSYSESAKADAEQINSRIDLAVESAESALQSAENAEAKSIIADEKAGLAELYSIMAESFTHGGTGLRENEAVDNAQYFLEQVRQISQSMNGLVPIGTVTFEELALEENQVTKYMFNISNDFITDDTFKEGAGHSFPAGTNVFRTNDGYWDCLAGSFQTPNGDTKDNVTAFVPASTRANIQSGEKHSIIFGKIAKFFADLKTVAFSGSYNDLLDKPSAGDVGAVATGGDVAENTVSYTEATALAELAPGEKLSVAFGKLKLAVKNVIAIAKLLGTTDISKIGDGTCTGAISAINTDLTQLNSDLVNSNSFSWEWFETPNKWLDGNKIYTKIVLWHNATGVTSENTPILNETAHSIVYCEPLYFGVGDNDNIRLISLGVLGSLDVNLEWDNTNVKCTNLPANWRIYYKVYAV